MKDEKWKPASPRQVKRILQLVQILGLGVNVQGELTGHKATVLINSLVVSERAERCPVRRARCFDEAIKVGDVRIDTHTGPGAWFGGAGF